MSLTVLHIAAEKGLTEVCQRILKSVTDKNPAGPYGTPLQLAAKKGNTEVCELFQRHLETDEN